jgi:hypothetical protein
MPEKGSAGSRHAFDLPGVNKQFINLPKGVLVLHPYPDGADTAGKDSEVTVRPLARRIGQIFNIEVRADGFAQLLVDREVELGRTRVGGNVVVDVR